MKEKKKSQSLLGGAAILMITTVIVHLINLFYKIPLTAIIGTVGRGYFNVTYELYTPLYAISMAGLPVAVSKLVSEHFAQGHYKDVRQIRKVARRLYFATGIFGTLLMCGLAIPYESYVKNYENLLPCLFLLAPAILFCCMMSSYRGYYEGLRNMKPTGYSQVIEAVIKMGVGIFLASAVMNYGTEQFYATGKVLGQTCSTVAQCESIMAPFTAAAAVIGVTAGTIVGLIYLQIRHQLVGDGITKEMLLQAPDVQESDRSLAKHIIKFAIPVMTTSLILNITNLIDSSTINNRLNSALDKDFDTVYNMYATAITQSGTLKEDIGAFLYGSYATAFDFRNLVPSVIMTLGLSAIPVLSGAFALQDKDKMRSSISTVLKTATLLSVPAGLCMAVLAGPILKIFYVGSKAEASLSITTPYVQVFGIFALLLSISTPITNMLQAVNRTDVPVKSLIWASIAKIVCNYILVSIPVINLKGAPVGTILFYIIVIAQNLHALLKETQVKIDWKDTFLRPAFAGVLAAAVCYGVYQICYGLFPEGAGQGRNAGFTYATIIAAIVAIISWVGFVLLLNVLSKEDVLGLPKGQKIAKVLEKRGLIK